MRAVTVEPEGASSPRLSDVAEPGAHDDETAFVQRPDDVTVVLEPGGSR
jgi:hypothetical protein